MSPEHARGEAIDHRSDLFSLGVVIYEMATGVQTFNGQTTAVIFDQILNRVPVPPSQINPDVIPTLEHIIGRLLEKDRDRRYQSARDVQADLQRLQAATSTPPRRHRRGGADVGPATWAPLENHDPRRPSPSTCRPSASRPRSGPGAGRVGRRLGAGPPVEQAVERARRPPAPPIQNRSAVDAPVAPSNRIVSSAATVRCRPVSGASPAVRPSRPPTPPPVRRGAPRPPRSPTARPGDFDTVVRLRAECAGADTVLVNERRETAERDDTPPRDSERDAQSYRRCGRASDHRRRRRDPDPPRARPDARGAPPRCSRSASPGRPLVDAAGSARCRSRRRDRHRRRAAP